MPMFTEEAAGPRTKAVSATPSLVNDLSWLLSGSARPPMPARHPKLRERLQGGGDPQPIRPPGPARVRGPTTQGGGRPPPAGDPALAGQGTQHGGRAGPAVPSGPAHGEHARQGPAGERSGALGAP